MNDPEVQQIMSDPAMRMILEQMQSDPQAVQVNWDNYSKYKYVIFILISGASTESSNHAEDNEAKGCWSDLHEL